MVPRGTINIILPGYLVNKCYIIPNSIRDYNTKDRHIICSPCLLLLSVGFGMLAQHRKNAENFEFSLTVFPPMQKEVKNSAKIYCVSGE